VIRRWREERRILRALSGDLPLTRNDEDALADVRSRIDAANRAGEPVPTDIWSGEPLSYRPSVARTPAERGRLRLPVWVTAAVSAATAVIGIVVGTTLTHHQAQQSLVRVKPAGVIGDDIVFEPSSTPRPASAAPVSSAPMPSIPASPSSPPATTPSRSSSPTPTTRPSPTKSPATPTAVAAAPPPTHTPTPSGTGATTGGTPAPAAPPTTARVPEYAGGVAHTWADYQDAGGQQGPSIPPGESVFMACKIQGFTVTDGNTWWYRIQSPPWSSAFYVSADAFYNNGRTAGSLTGTPFVDPSVPDC
jgi:hypothetical protein